MSHHRVEALALHLVEARKPERDGDLEEQVIADGAQTERPDANLEQLSSAIDELIAARRESAKLWREACDRLGETFDLLGQVCVLLLERTSTTKK